MWIPDLLRSKESKLVEQKIIYAAKDILNKEYNIKWLDMYGLAPLSIYSLEYSNMYSIYLTQVIAFIIFQDPLSFTKEFNAINIPSIFSDTDADNLVSILRKAGNHYGLSIHRLDTRSFSTQWEKEYISGYDREDDVFYTNITEEIISNIKPDMSNYTNDIYEMYVKDGAVENDNTHKLLKKYEKGIIK